MTLQINISIVISLKWVRTVAVCCEFFIAAENRFTCQMGTDMSIWYMWWSAIFMNWHIKFDSSFLWLNIITIKMDNCNNLVITFVFAYFKAAIYANDPVPSGGQQDYGTSLLACVAFCVLLCTCNSIRFHPWLKVSLVTTRP